MLFFSLFLLFVGLWHQPNSSPQKNEEITHCHPILAPKQTAKIGPKLGSIPSFNPSFAQKTALRAPCDIVLVNKNNCFEQCCATACQHQVSVTMLHVLLPSHCAFCLLWLPTVGPCPSWGPHATATTATIAKSAETKQPKMPLLKSLLSKPNLLCCHFANNPQNARIICIFGSND